MKAKFQPDQPVTLTFGDGGTFEAVIIENIDASCRPLTDMWLVRVVEDGEPWARPFGFSGKAITPRETECAQ